MNKELCKDCKYEMVCGTMVIPGKNVEFSNHKIVKCDEYENKV